MDVYSAWCGPCKAVTGLFRRVKNEIGDDLLRFGLVAEFVVVIVVVLLFCFVLFLSQKN